MEEEVKRLKEYEASKIETSRDEANWFVYASIKPDDTTHALKLLYKDEIGLSQQIVYGMVVWENIKTNEYKVTAPWIDNSITIQKSNLLDLEPRVVLKIEVR